MSSSVTESETLFAWGVTAVPRALRQLRTRTPESPDTRSLHDSFTPISMCNGRDMACVGCHVEHTLIRETRPQSLLQKLVRARYPHRVPAHAAPHLYRISAPQGSLSSERSHQVVKGLAFLRAKPPSRQSRPHRRCRCQPMSRPPGLPPPPRSTRRALPHGCKMGASRV